ncbi:MAG: pilus assembly protein PilP [Thermodesulfobacteriota bacterium]
MNKVKMADRPQKSFLWVLALVGFLCLAVALGAGCGLIGGGDKDQAPSKVQKKVGAKPTPAAGETGAAPAAAEEAEEEGLTLEKLRAEKEKKDQLFVFTREGKVDPFMPMEAILAVRVGPGPVPGPEVPPIQRLALSQFRLVAVVIAAENTRALVEDSTGTGYIIKAGTKIGLQNGTVTAIEPGQVQVQEEVVDKYTRETKKMTQVLKLRPDEGEKK